MSVSLQKYFSPIVTEAIVASARSDAEICGLIVDLEGTQTLYHSDNLASDPENNFEIDPEVYVWAESEGVILAAYHTHIKDTQSGCLSPTDINKSKLNQIPYLLYHTVFQCWDYYEPGNPNPYPLKYDFRSEKLESYLGWVWEYNRCDCATLLLSFYKGMLGIEIKDYPRPRNLKTFSHDLYANNLIDTGFEQVSAPLKPYDVVLMAIDYEAPHHIGIVMKDCKTILHHYGVSAKSEITPYHGTNWEYCTRSIWRHKDLK